MDQFWHWRLLVDQQITAPHVDRMMKLLSDMKGVKGQALPSTLPGTQQQQLLSLTRSAEKHTRPAVKRPLPVKPSAEGAAATAAHAAPAESEPSRRPPITARSFEEALQECAKIEKRLDEYKEKAKQDIKEAIKWGDDEAIKKADYNWQIVTSIVNDLRETNPNFVEPSLVDQLIYGCCEFECF